MGLRFEDPPLKATKADQWAEVRTQLIANSGQWAILIEEGKPGTVTGLQRRITQSIGPWRGHRWEATTRTIRDGVLRLYARHMDVA
jgi:hypothetical protein